MFKRRQFLNHRRYGVSLVKDIASLSNATDNVEYYVLEPQFGEDKGSIIRVPTSNEVSLRPIMTKKECLSMISSFKIKDSIYINDVKIRKNTYESLISSGDISKLLSLLFGTKQKKALVGKINSIDHQFLIKAEPIVFGNIAFAMSIPYDKVEEYLNKNCN